MVFFFTFCSVG